MATQRLPGVTPRGAQARAKETPSGERPGSPAWPAGRPRLLRGRGLPLVLALEPLDAAGRVHELLLSREERMALGAHFHANLGPGRSSADDLAARTGNGRVHVVRMNTHLHGDSPPRSPNNTSAPPKTQKPQRFPLFRYPPRRGRFLATGGLGSRASSCGGVRSAAWPPQSRGRQGRASRQAGPARRKGAKPPPSHPMVCIEARNSLLLRVSFSLSSRSSIPSTGFS